MHTKPVLGHLAVVEVDEYWEAGEHGNPTEDSHLHGRCLYSRTKLDSTPWGDCAAWREEIQPLFFSKWRRHQVQYWVCLQIQCAGSDERSPGTTQQLALLVGMLQRKLEVAYIGYRVGSNILRMELKASKYISEKLRSG